MLLDRSMAPHDNDAKLARKFALNAHAFMMQRPFTASMGRMDVTHQMFMANIVFRLGIIAAGSIVGSTDLGTVVPAEASGALFA